MVHSLVTSIIYKLQGRKRFAMFRTESRRLAGDVGSVVAPGHAQRRAWPQLDQNRGPLRAKCNLNGPAGSL